MTDFTPPPRASERCRHYSYKRPDSGPCCALGKAVQALPRAIPLRSGGVIDCPNCDGKIRYDRWHRGADLRCSTPYCCAAHFSIAAGVDWPSRGD